MDKKNKHEDKSIKDMVLLLKKIRNKNNNKKFKTTDELTVNVGFEGYEDD